MPLKSVVFTAGTHTWHSPVGVNFGFLTMAGGGIGGYGCRNHYSYLGPSMGGGSAETCVNRKVPITPDTDYEIVVGDGSAGTGYLVFPPVPDPTTAFGFRAFGSAQFPDEGGPGPGAGGGCGGAQGGTGGEETGGLGHVECCHFTGGTGGAPVGIPGRDGSGTQGGIRSLNGVNVLPEGGGGAGAGCIWGDATGTGNTGGNAHEVAPNGNVNHYGAAAGGAGEPESGDSYGAKGSPGICILMYFEP